MKMKIGIVTEVSTSLRNKDIVSGMEKIGKPFFNLGMKGVEGEPELSIVETGFLSALLLNTGSVDFIIGGCGTGQGYANCVIQYPGVVCGLVNDPLNAWLFPQINDGNCVSLALNKDYGWAGDVNLSFILKELFAVESGGGYPEHRKAPQKIIRSRMQQISISTHFSFIEIIDRISQYDDTVLRNVLTFPGVMDFIRENAVDETLCACTEAAYRSL